ncbi:hypothetical protein HGRIS_006847 [Hohenbuehelia grisea]|uniref:Uncharacterized protein n=1 Tax=Hohenbuehelia grisea TaxID=104357 RepID=A0ABR3JAT0_9AGAR
MSAGSSGGPVIVDDRDPAIVYSPDWFLGGGPDEFDGTTHGTNSNGASFQFQFNGTSVSVIGTLSPLGYRDSVPPVSTYRVDDANPTTFSPTTDADVHHQVTFFTSPSLQDGVHTLFMTCIVENTFLWFDYLLVQPVASSDPASAGPTPSPDSITKTVVRISSAQQSATSPESSRLSPSQMSTSLQTPGSGSSVYSRASSSQMPSTSSTTHISTSTQLSTLSSGGIPTPTSTPSFPTGAVVGGVVGGITVIALLVLFILLRWRRQRAIWANSGTYPQPFTGAEPPIDTVSNNNNRMVARSGVPLSSYSSPSLSSARYYPASETSKTHLVDSSSYPSGSAHREPLGADRLSMAYTSTEYDTLPPPSYVRSISGPADVLPMMEGVPIPNAV